MKKTLSVVLALLLVLSMCFAFAGCGGDDQPTSGGEQQSGGEEQTGGSEAEAVTLHFGSTQGTGHAWYEAATKFAEAVKATNTGLDIAIEFGGVHGSDKDHAEMVQNGSLDMYLGSTVGFDAIVTEIGFVNLPYVVTNYDQVDSLIYNGWIGETLINDADKVGIKVIGLTDCDFRWISNSKHPIESGADIAGLKMRVPESPMFMEFFENLGAQASALAFTELPSALQQGMMDGQDNGPTLSYPNGLYEFNKYWTKSNHSFASAVIAINPDKWASLSADQQAALQTCVDQLAEDCKTLLREDVGEMTQGMIDYGCKVIEPTEQFDTDMRAAAEKVWNSDTAVGNFDQEAVARILDELA